MSADIQRPTNLFEKEKKSRHFDFEQQQIS
jgi:hypothetical protein